MGFTFRGIKKDYITLLASENRPAWAPIRRKMYTVAGRPGAVLEDTEVGPRPIPLPVKLTYDSFNDLQKLKEELADWLITDNPEALIIDDEPDRIYFAVVDGEFNIDEFVKKGKGIITFICPDPYKYGPIKTLNPPVTDLNSPIILHNGGSVGTPPIFDVSLKGNTTYLDIIGDEDYMRIGRPVNIDDFAVAPKELILWDQMNSLVGWGDAASSDIDGGVVTGTMLSDGYKFYANDFGSGSAWHGPAKIKSLGQSLTDFEAEILLALGNNSLSTVGRVELYLLDESKKAVGKLSLKDISTGRDGNFAEMRAGDNSVNNFIINERGDTWDTWTNFDGMLRLTRTGNKWIAYVAKIVNGTHTARRYIEWVDLDNQFTRKVAHVVVHIGANGANAPSSMAINDVKVYKLNQLTASQIPYIGTAGDVFTFDHKKNVILKNGEPFMNKDFGARFFHLQKGDNALVFNPATAIQSVEAEWRDRYK